MSCRSVSTGSSRSRPLSSVSSRSASTLDVPAFFHVLSSSGVGFYCGVADFLLRNFLAFLSDHVPPERHVVAANEGAAVALAAGHYLASGQVGCVYLPNTGLGNAVNPLLSMCHPAVYNVPVLLLVSWRGEPGTKDDAQYMAQGKLTVPMLQNCEVPFEILPRDLSSAQKAVSGAFRWMLSRKAPFAIVVQGGTFAEYTSLAAGSSSSSSASSSASGGSGPGGVPVPLPPSPSAELLMTREEAVKKICEALGERDVLISTTGLVYREVPEAAGGGGLGHERDLLVLGCMGHATSIALGVALGQPERQVYCLDGGSGAAGTTPLAHLGAIATVGQLGRSSNHAGGAGASSSS
eukprot:RCo044479